LAASLVIRYQRTILLMAKEANGFDILEALNIVTDEVAANPDTPALLLFNELVDGVETFNTVY
jgi:hypothetical protein